MGCDPCSARWGGGRAQISDAPTSPQSSNPRVGPQLPFHIVTAGPEDDASGAAGLELASRPQATIPRSTKPSLTFGGGIGSLNLMDRSEIRAGFAAVLSLAVLAISFFSETAAAAS